MPFLTETKYSIHCQWDMTAHNFDTPLDEPTLIFWFMLIIKEYSFRIYDAQKKWQLYFVMKILQARLCCLVTLRQSIQGKYIGTMRPKPLSIHICLFKPMVFKKFRKYEIVIKYVSKHSSVQDSWKHVMSMLTSHLIKVHIFWEGHKILRNLHQLFVLCNASQIIAGDFAKFCGLLRLYEL